MKYTSLGKSGMQVSRFCVGCMSFGDPASKMHAWTLDPEESKTIVKHALDLGMPTPIRRAPAKNISAAPSKAL